MPGLRRAAHCRGPAAEGEYEIAACLQVVSKNSTNPLLCAHVCSEPRRPVTCCTHLGHRLGHRVTHAHRPRTSAHPYFSAPVTPTHTIR